VGKKNFMYSKSTKLIIGLLIFLNAVPTFGGQASVSGLMKLEGFKMLVLTIGKVNSAMRIAAKNPMDKWRRKAVQDAMRLMPVAIMGLAKEFKSGKLHDDDIQRVLAVLGPFVDVNAPARFKSFLENPKEEYIPAVGNQFPKEYLNVAVPTGGGSGSSQGSAVDENAGGRGLEEKPSKDVLDLKKLPNQGSLKLNNLHPLLMFAENFIGNNVWAATSNIPASAPAAKPANNTGNSGSGSPCAGGCDQGSGGSGGSGGGGGGKGAEILMALAIAAAAIVPAAMQAQADKEAAQQAADAAKYKADLQYQMTMQNAQMAKETAEMKMAQEAQLADAQRQQQQQAMMMQYQQQQQDAAMRQQRADQERADNKADRDLQYNLLIAQQQQSFRLAAQTAANTQGVGQIINSGNALSTQPLTGGVQTTIPTLAGTQLALTNNTSNTAAATSNLTALSTAQATQQRALGQRLLNSVNNGLPSTSAKKGLTLAEKKDETEEEELDPKKKALKKNLPKVSKALKQNLAKVSAVGSTASSVRAITVAKNDLTQQRPTFAQSLRNSTTTAVRQPSVQTTAQAEEGYRKPSFTHRGLQ
jgi:hypothetical protein